MQADTPIKVDGTQTTYGAFLDKYVGVSGDWRQDIEFSLETYGSHYSGDDDDRHSAPFRVISVIK